jgi:hypothetical protein
LPDAAQLKGMMPSRQAGENPAVPHHKFFQFDLGR